MIESLCSGKVRAHPLICTWLQQVLLSIGQERALTQLGPVKGLMNWGHSEFLAVYELF